MTIGATKFMLLYSFFSYVIGRYAVFPKLKAKGISEISITVVGLALIFTEFPSLRY